MLRYFRRNIKQKDTAIFKNSGLNQLVAISIFFFALNANAQSYYPREDQSHSQYNGNAISFAKRVKSNAVALVKAGIKKRPSLTFWLVLAALTKAQFVRGQDQECFKTDSYGNVWAYTYPGSWGNIFICDSFADQDNDSAAQTLVHEAAHLIGIANECKANDVAHKAMRAAGREPVPNKYDSTCEAGLDPYGRH